MLLKIVKDDKKFGLLQADTTSVSYRRPITFQKRDFSCSVTPFAGYSWQQGKQLCSCLALFPLALVTT